MCVREVHRKYIQQRGKKWNVRITPHRMSGRHMDQEKEWRTCKIHWNGKSDIDSADTYIHYTRMHVCKCTCDVCTGTHSHCLIQTNAQKLKREMLRVVVVLFIFWLIFCVIYNLQFECMLNESNNRAWYALHIVQHVEICDTHICGWNRAWYIKKINNSIG